MDEVENRGKNSDANGELKSQNNGSESEKNDIEGTNADSGEETYERNGESKNNSDKKGTGSQETGFKVVFNRQGNNDKGPSNEENKHGSEENISQRDSSNK